MTAVSDDITTRLRRDCMSLIADEAADTIDRLRVERDEARLELKVMTEEHRLACEDRDLMQRERDEARRMVCGLDADIMEDQRDYAKQRGWDCFDSVPADIEAHEIRGDLPGGNA